MLAHYTAAAVLLTHEPFGDWSYAARATGIVVVGGLVYLGGQGALWLLYLEATHRVPGKAT
jgi:hypothetical protein